MFDHVTCVYGIKRSLAALGGRLHGLAKKY